MRFSARRSDQKSALHSSNLDNAARYKSHGLDRRSPKSLISPIPGPRNPSRMGCLSKKTFRKKSEEDT